MSRLLARMLALVALAALPSIGHAQQTPPPLLQLGDIAVTGFSGTVAPDPHAPRPAGKSAADLTFIDAEGPSARIVDASRPGHVWEGRVVAAPKTFSAAAKDVGQVFGIAIDDQTPPNVYVAATSAFGLNIVARDRNGQF